MPTAYFIETTREASAIVDACDLGAASAYVAVPSEPPESDDPNRVAMPQEMKEIDDSNPEKLRAYHLASYAVDTCQLTFLEGFQESLDLLYSPHGNAYKLAQLAIDNLKSAPKDKEKGPILETVNFLLSLALERDQISVFDYPSRLLVPFAAENDDYELIDKLLNAGINAWNFYHYSIAWDHPDATLHLIENWFHIIDLRWTAEALNIAERFGSKRSIEFVKSDKRLWTKDKRTKPLRRIRAKGPTAFKD